MRLRLVLALSFMGLVTACGGDDQPDGVGTGASSATALRYGTLSELTYLNDVAVQGTVRDVSDEAGSLAVTLEVAQTVWSQSGVAPVGGTIHFTQPADGSDSVAPEVGDDTIVFLSRGNDGAWTANGGASGRFRVDGGIVTPVASDGVGVPAGTDVAGFAALLVAPAPAPSSDDASGSGYGYGGGSY